MAYCLNSHDHLRCTQAKELRPLAMRESTDIRGKVVGAGDAKGMYDNHIWIVEFRSQRTRNIGLT